VYGTKDEFDEHCYVTGLTTESAIGAEGDREFWRKIVYDATSG